MIFGPTRGAKSVAGGARDSGAVREKWSCQLVARQLAVAETAVLMRDGRLSTLARFQVSHAYRADISGLRALAVLPVLLFHFDVPYVGGGFVGVDVFFVISGYVIARSVYEHLERGPTGTFQFLGWFYERRTRRILPALLFVSALTFVGAYILFLPDRFTAFAWSLFASAALSANIYFWLTSDYFAAAAHTQPLLHYWSLGVEEHFYLVFPLLILALWRFGMRIVGVVLIVVLIVSLVASQAALGSVPESVFYLFHFRAWELLCGSVLALPAVRAPRSSVTAALAAFLGAGLLAWSIHFTDENSFPGVAALPACLAALAMIWAGQRNNAMSTAIGAAPVEYIGRISYSLYLVHWPVVVFAKYLRPEISTWDLVLAALPISILLAMLSYHCIEQPTRSRTGIWTRGRVVGFSSLGLAAAAGLATIIITTNGLVSRLPADVQQLAMYRFDHDAAYRTGVCFLGPSQQHTALQEVCLPRTGRVMLVWGDSYAAHLVPGLQASVARLGLTLAQANASLCPPIVGREQPRRPFCKEFNDAILTWIKNEKPEVVILSALWPVDSGSLTAMKSAIAEYSKQTDTKFIVLGPSPVYTQRVPEMLAWRKARRDMSNHATIRTKTLRDEKILKTAVISQNAVPYISMIDTACVDGVCPIMGAEPFHLDYGHMTVEGSFYFVQAILPRVRALIEGAPGRARPVP
jgi:peptidoglycan/LPS O-acetylase OafA/YrhL